MAKAVTTLAFFFIALSLFSGTLHATGVADTLHLNQRTGGGEAVNTVQSQAQSVESGSPTGSTLFGMYNVLSDQLTGLFGIFNPGLRMLYNVGGPAWLFGSPNQIGLLPPLASFIKFIGIVSFLRGFGL